MLTSCGMNIYDVVVVVMVCRDLRPANVLLGDRGHILLTYFSQWNTVECRVNDQADSLYCAPGHSLSYFVILCLYCKPSSSFNKY